MDYHHVCLVVSDMDRSLRLYRDTMGFPVLVDTAIPDAKEFWFSQRTLDDIFHVAGAKSRMVMLGTTTGAKLELQQPETPRVEQVERRFLGYGYVGITEVAYRVTGIDEWFLRIRAAGYETQTDYVWTVGRGLLRTFLFFDPDGNLIQLCEDGAKLRGTDRRDSAAGPEKNPAVPTASVG